MSRLYETAASRKIEDDIAASFAAVYGFSWKRYTESLVTPDHVFTGKHITYYAETKRRYYKFKQMEDYFIDLSKVQRLRIHRVPVILVGFNDVFGYFELLRVSHYKTSRGGRTDRNDKHDIDVLAHFRWDDLIVCGSRNGNYK